MDAAAKLDGELIAAQSELEGLEQIYTKDNARVRSLQARVDELRSQLHKIGGDIGTADGKPGAAQEFPSIRQLPLLGVRWAELYRETKIQETVYELLTQQYELAKIEEAKEIPVVKVLDLADVPEKKSFPPRALIGLMGMVMAFSTACAWVLAKNQWDTTDECNPRKAFWLEVGRSIRSDGQRFWRCRSILPKGPRWAGPIYRDLPMAAMATVMKQTELQNMPVAKGPEIADVAAGRSASEFLIANSASTVGFRAVAGFARIGILLAIAHAYGPGSFGQVSLAMSLVEILRTFSEFGVDTISIRKFSQTAFAERTDLLASIAGTKLILGAGFYCLGVGVLFLIADNRSEVLLGAIAALTLFCASALGAISSYLQSSFSMSRIFRTTLYSSLLSVGLASIAIYNKAPLLMVMACLPAADGLNLLLLSKAIGVPFGLRFSFSQALGLLRESLPVGMMAVMVVLYVRLDNIFVFKFAGASALGLYALCYRIIEPGLIVPAAFATTVYAFLSRAEHQGMV